MNDKKSQTQDPLKDKSCIPCEGGVPALSLAKKSQLLKQLDKNWSLVDQGSKLELRLEFKDFKAPMEVANKIATIADKQWHHPDLLISYGGLLITLWTHKIGDLVESDFIFAAKVDEVIENYED